MQVVQLAIKLSCGHIHIRFFASTVDWKWKTFRCNLVANLWKCCLAHVEMSSCIWNVGNWITTKAVVWRSRKTTCTFHRALLFTTITVGDLPSALVLWFIGFPLHPSTPPTTMIVQQPTAKSALCNAGIFYFQCSLTWDDVQWWIVVEIASQTRKRNAAEEWQFSTTTAVALLYRGCIIEMLFSSAPSTSSWCCWYYYYLCGSSIAWVLVMYCEYRQAHSCTFASAISWKRKPIV